MNLLNYTSREESWQPRIKSGSRDDVLNTILKHLCSPAFFEVNSDIDASFILEELIKREKQRTTAVGQEIAFPHARLENLTQALFAVATLETPVLFDEFPVRIVCLILVPASEPTISLKMMAQMSRMLTVPAVHDAVLAADSAKGLRHIFQQSNPRIDKPIIARDIMRPPRFSVLESDPVSKCSHLMSVNNLHAVPVVNDRQEIVGEITVERLFRYGLPEFFVNLKSVSFIAEFDPFEKYFEDERNTPVSEMMSEACTVPTDYTIMEVVFDLAIQSHSKLYVADEAGRWVGTIDKGTVLDNVINH